VLLDAGADVELAADNGFTSLMKAAQNGHDLCARALLENGAAVNSQNNEGGTALMFAATNGHDQVRSSHLEHMDSCTQLWCV
jgi:ankyrin repeat protein